jgi:hypothetical protein
MAGLQYKNRGSTEYGYSNGIESGLIGNWTDVGLSGSHEAIFYWDDSDGGPTKSRMKMRVRDSWSGTINSDNSITLNITSSYDMWREVWQGGACSTRVIGVFPGSGYNDTIMQKYEYWNISTGGSHSFSRSWTLTLGHGQSRELGSFYVVNLWQSGCGVSPCHFSSVHPTEWYCTGNRYTDHISAGVMFRNTLPAPPYPPSVSLSCAIVPDSTNGEVKSSVSDWGCPSGNSCNLNHSVIWSTSSTYDPVAATGTGVKGLMSNTTYYVKATATNGHKTTTKTCSFTTLASSYPYAYKYVSDQVSKMNIQINNGNDACDIETKFYIREAGTSAWTLVDTSSSESGYTKTMRNLIQRGKTYEAKTETTNCAGTYHSAIYTFAPPAADNITGEVTSTSGFLEQSGLLADLDYCYKVTSYTLTPVSEQNPMTSHLEYRPEGQTDWVTTDTVTSTESPATICGQITGLLCGTSYEVRSYQKVGVTDSYSAVVTVAMPLCADVNNCVCQSLEYMSELICQELNKIETGQKDIYANCQVKKLCDPYSDNPTIASILSRIVRFSQMTGCLLCSMDALVAFGAGQTNQVYTATEPGQFGEWITLEDQLVEDSDNLISSNATYEAINTMLHSTFRPIGTYDYYAEDITDLRTQAPNPGSGKTAVIGDSYFTYTNSWRRTGLVPDLQDLGLVNILSGTWAQREFFWWDDKWNLLDLDPSTEPRIAALEDAEDDIVLNYDTSNEENMMTAPINYTDAQLVTLAHQKFGNAREVVVYLTDGSLTSSPFILDVSHLDGTDVLG